MFAFVLKSLKNLICWLTFGSYKPDAAEPDMKNYNPSSEDNLFIF